MKRALPRLGQFVPTPQGVGKVIGLQTLKQRVVVFIEGAGAADFAAEELGEVIAPARPAPRSAGPGTATRPASPARATDAPERPRLSDQVAEIEQTGATTDEVAAEGDGESAEGRGRRTRRRGRRGARRGGGGPGGAAPSDSGAE
jgi:hypothetical protein